MTKLHIDSSPLGTMSLQRGLTFEHNSGSIVIIEGGFRFVPTAEEIGQLAAMFKSAADWYERNAG